VRLPFDVFTRAGWLYKNNKVKLKDVIQSGKQVSYYFECNGYDVRIWNQEVGENVYKYLYSCTCDNQIFAGAKYNIACCHIMACMAWLTIMRGFNK
jgi:hypothetical protein